MSESINITLPVDTLEGTEAKVSEWLVKEGDLVVQGAPLLELETDKVTMEVCAQADGIIAKILAAPGDDVGEGSVLGLITTQGAAGGNSVAPAGSNSVASHETAAIQESPLSTDAQPSQACTVMDIVLPEDQLEGTTAKVGQWLVEVGALVEQGAPVLELETDKVAMEVVAPATGILTLQAKQVDDDVEAGVILGQLEVRHSGQSHTEDHPPKGETTESLAINPSTVSADNALVSGERCTRHLIGPAVRRLLKQHQLDIDLIEGSGRGGRVTRDDVLAYIRSPQPRKVAAPIAATQAAQPKATSSSVPQSTGDKPASHMVPHTSMRKAIANHMVDSLLQTSPHVTSVFEMDMGSIIEHRKMCKMGFNEAGVKLTFTAYFLIAAAKAMREVPSVNARFHEEALEIFDDVNIGIGTALGDDGLVVPVVKQVQNKNLFEVASALQLQTDKARTGKLTAADMKGGTFTISNHGVSGSLFATPIIINQPQVAILGIGKLEKRVVVEEVDGEDVIKVRPKCYVSLSIDHRALDAHQTNLFLSHFVTVIENWGQ